MPDSEIALRAAVFRESEELREHEVVEENVLLGAARGACGPGAGLGGPTRPQLITVDDKDPEQIVVSKWWQVREGYRYWRGQSFTLPHRDWCALVEWWEITNWGAAADAGPLEEWDETDQPDDPADSA